MPWNPIPEAERRAHPGLVAGLTWFVPGAGHLYLGQRGMAVAGFVLIQGLYLLGLRLSDGMLLEYLEPDLRGLFAGALTPEAGNLGMLVYQTKTYGYGIGVPRVWPEWIHVGTWLTAISGFLNACWMAHATLEAGRRRGTPARAAPLTGIVLAWLVPGLGHVAQRRHVRAAIVFGTLVGLFVLGTWLCAGSNLDRERHFYYWAGQFLIGAPAMVAEALHGHALVTGELPYVDCGLGMTCVAGLLNVLAMIDVLNYAEEREAAVPTAPPEIAVPREGSLA